MSLSVCFWQKGKGKKGNTPSFLHTHKPKKNVAGKFVLINNKVFNEKKIYVPILKLIELRVLKLVEIIFEDLDDKNHK